MSRRWKRAPKPAAIVAPSAPAFAFLSFQRFRGGGALLASASIELANAVTLRVDAYEREAGGLLVAPSGGGEFAPRPILNAALIEALREAFLQRIAAADADAIA